MGHVVKSFSGHWYGTSLSGPKINLQTSHGAVLCQSHAKRLECRTHVRGVNSSVGVYCQSAFKELRLGMDIHATACILSSSLNQLLGFLPSKYLHSHIMCLALNSPQYDTCCRNMARLLCMRFPVSSKKEICGSPWGIFQRCWHPWIEFLGIISLSKSS